MRKMTQEGCDQCGNISVWDFEVVELDPDSLVHIKITCDNGHDYLRGYERTTLNE